MLGADPTDCVLMAGRVGLDATSDDGVAFRLVSSELLLDDHRALLPLGDSDDEVGRRPADMQMLARLRAHVERSESRLDVDDQARLPGPIDRCRRPASSIAVPSGAFVSTARPSASRGGGESHEMIAAGIRGNETDSNTAEKPDSQRGLIVRAPFEASSGVQSTVKGVPN